MLDTLSTQTTKHRIMDAAETIVMEKGAAHLTFDELVKVTGLSKGGILYHYSSKKTLLREMVQRMIADFETRRDRRMSTVENTALANAKTYILASFDKPEQEHRSSTALLAAAANDPELLTLVRDHYRKNFQQIFAEGDKAVLAMMIHLVADGVWFLDAMRLCPLDAQQRDTLKNSLLRLADGEAI